MLELQSFVHLMHRADSLEKTLMLGKTEGRRKGGWQRIRLLDGITDSKDTSLSKLQGKVKDREARHAAVHGVTKSQTWLSNWTTMYESLIFLQDKVYSRCSKDTSWLKSITGNLSISRAVSRLKLKGTELTVKFSSACCSQTHGQYSIISSSPSSFLTI